VGIYYCAGLTAQLPAIKPAQIRKYNIKTVKYTKTKQNTKQTKQNKTKQNNNDMAEKSQYKRGT
jgi:hypothetical protein